MKNTFAGIIKLTRFNEYIWFVMVTTLLGVGAAGGEFGWRLLVAILANWLAVGFAFMINDVEDAPDDALSENKIKRNPVSAGMISTRTGYIASFVTAILAAVAFAFLGWVPFLLGLFCLLLGWLYSYSGIRLKTIAFLDVASHLLMLAGLQFLCAYFTFSNSFNEIWLFPFLLVTCVSAYGELFNEVRDIEGDRKAGLRHTGIVLGEKTTQFVMYLLLGIAVISGVITFFFTPVMKDWAVIALVIIGIIMLVPQIIKVRKAKSSMEVQTPLHKPLEFTAAAALFLNFFLPWLDQLLKLNIFK